MVSIKYVYDLVNDLADQNNGRQITAEEFTRYAQLTNLEVYDEYIGARNKKIDNRTLVNFGRSQDTDRRLDIFKEGATVPIVDGDGTLPVNCGKILNVLQSKKIPKAITRIDDDRLGMLYGNPLREPDADDIYYRDGNKSIEIFGAISSVYVNYLRLPVDPVYKEKDVEITVGDRTVIRKEFDEVGSVNFEWDNREAYDLVVRILQKAGIPMKDNFIEQMVNNIKTEE